MSIEDFTINLFDPLTEQEKEELKIRKKELKGKHSDYRSKFIRKLRIEKVLIPFFTIPISVENNQKFNHLCEEVERSLIRNDLETHRHSAFETSDLEFHEGSSVFRISASLVLPIICQKWGFPEGGLELIDLFVVVYDESGQRKLDAHTDGCLISFNIQLNNPDEFEGGGTLLYIDKTQEILIQLKKGECLVHDSKTTHAGKEIRRGTRKILVGFVETLKEAKVKKRLMRMSAKRSL